MKRVMTQEKKVIIMILLGLFILGMRVCFDIGKADAEEMKIVK